MKIDELIDKLQKAKEKSGNIECCTYHYTPDGNFHEYLTAVYLASKYQWGNDVPEKIVEIK